MHRCGGTINVVYIKSKVPYGTGIYVEVQYSTLVKADSRVNAVPNLPYGTVPYGTVR